MDRKYGFYEKKIFHVFNKSIANFRILSHQEDCQRLIQTLAYYADPIKKINFGNYIKNNPLYNPDLLIPEKNACLKFISFCLMPDHYHLLVKINQSNTFSKYLSNVENSYTRYFNLKHNRKGPLWQSRFKAVEVTSNEQLLHVSRYIHLNPTSSELTDKPENWQFSSYKKIITEEKYLSIILNEISIKNNTSYQRFVASNQEYQHTLKMKRKLFLDLNM